MGRLCLPTGDQKEQQNETRWTGTAVGETRRLFLPHEPLARQYLRITRSGNQLNEGWGLRSWSTTLTLVNEPHYLTTKHTRECSLTQVRLAVSVKESNKYWCLQAIEVSAAEAVGGSARVGTACTTTRAGKKRYAQKNRDVDFLLWEKHIPCHY